MSTSIFIRTYHADLGWLSYCLRSIQRFCSNFKEVVITIPEGQKHLLSHLTAERVIGVYDAQPGYKGQQVSKLTADIHTDSQFVLHCDSDCIFTKPVTPQTFMRDNKALWYWRPWKDCADEERKAWMHVTTKLLQSFPPGEFMRKSTMMIPRFGYAALREFIQKTHGIPMEAYLMNQPNNEASEYNYMGAYLYEHHRERVAWHNESVDGPPPSNELQFWSYGGLTEEIRNKMEAILA